MSKNKLQKLFQGRVCQTHRQTPEALTHKYNIYYSGYYSGFWLERPGYVWPSEGLSSPLALVCLSLSLAFLPTDGERKSFRENVKSTSREILKPKGKRERARRVLRDRNELDEASDLRDYPETSRSLSRALPIIPITNIISPRQLTIIFIRPVSWDNHNFVPARAF